MLLLLLPSLSVVLWRLPLVTSPLMSSRRMLDGDEGASEKADGPHDVSSSLSDDDEYDDPEADGVDDDGEDEDEGERSLSVGGGLRRLLACFDCARSTGRCSGTGTRM